MTALATGMSDDGHALRVVGSPTDSWEGNTSNAIGHFVVNGVAMPPGVYGRLDPGGGVTGISYG